MYRNNFYLSFGAWLVVVSQLGIPGNWVRIIVLVSGVFLMLVSLGPTILKKLQPKIKIRKKPGDNKLRFSAQENIFSQNAEIKQEAEQEAEK